MAQLVKALATQTWQPEFETQNPGKGKKKKRIVLWYTEEVLSVHTL